jgi:hypothetical protein
LLDQDHDRLELIISDNASDDRTPEICRSFAAKDARVRYERAPENRGAIWNFRHVLELARGEYFMWAAYDDTRDHKYVSACLEAFRSHPEAVLVCTSIQFIDEDGQEFEVEPHLVGIRPIGASPNQRIARIARAEHWYDFYGLTRTEVLRSTRGPVPGWGFDVVVLAEMCLRGPVVAVPRRLFRYRRFRGKSADDLARTLAAGHTGIPVCWTCMTLELRRAIWLSPYGALRRVGMLSSFLLTFCVRNRAAGASIRTDLGPNLRRAFGGRHWGKAATLLFIGALIYPIHNRVTRVVYRALKGRPIRRGQSRHAEVSPRT